MNLLPDSPAQILEKLREKRARPNICEYAQPRDELERTVCEIWSDVLGFDRVGRNDNILDLGGDSFHMAVIAARLADSYGLEVHIGDFFEHATIAGMVACFRVRLGITLTAVRDPAQPD